MSKLLFCLASEYPLNTERIGGGVSHVMYMLGETFAEREDIDFHIVTPAKGMRGIDVVARPGVTIHWVGAPEHRILPNLLTQGRRMAPVMRERRPDVINSHHCVTTDAAVRAGCKVVHTIHGVIHREVRYAGRQHKLARYLHGVLEKRAVASANAVMGVAQYALDAYKPWIKSPAHLLPVPIEDMFWSVPPLEKSKSIVFAGGISKRKNLMVLIKAMAMVVKRHPDAVLHVCGNIVEPQYMAAIQSVIDTERLGRSVSFLGVVDRYRLAELLANRVRSSCSRIRRVPLG